MAPCCQVPARVDVLSSHDGGATWNPAPAVPGMYWANLFLSRGAAPLLGTGGAGGGGIVITRFNSSSSTWRTVELFPWPGGDVGSYATGATPLLVAQGRVWRAFELWRTPHRCTHSAHWVVPGALALSGLRWLEVHPLKLAVVIAWHFDGC